MEDTVHQVTYIEICKYFSPHIFRSIISFLHSGNIFSSSRQNLSDKLPLRFFWMFHQNLQKCSLIVCTYVSHVLNTQFCCVSYFFLSCLSKSAQRQMTWSYSYPECWFGINLWDVFFYPVFYGLGAVILGQIHELLILICTKLQFLNK